MLRICVAGRLCVVRSLGATNHDGGDDGAYPYPALVIDDAAQMSALRLFLESARNVSFGFHGES
jgi:hypothetical protein